MNTKKIISILVLIFSFSISFAYVEADLNNTNLTSDQIETMNSDFVTMSDTLDLKLSDPYFVMNNLNYVYEYTSFLDKTEQTINNGYYDTRENFDEFETQKNNIEQMMANYNYESGFDIQQKTMDTLSQHFKKMFGNINIGDKFIGNQKISININARNIEEIKDGNVNLNLDLRTKSDAKNQKIQFSVALKGKIYVNMLGNNMKNNINFDIGVNLIFLSDNIFVKINKINIGHNLDKSLDSTSYVFDTALSEFKSKYLGKYVKIPLNSSTSSYNYNFWGNYVEGILSSQKIKNIKVSDLFVVTESSDNKSTMVISPSICSLLSRQEKYKCLIEYTDPNYNDEMLKIYLYNSENQNKISANDKDADFQIIWNDKDINNVSISNHSNKKEGFFYSNGDLDVNLNLGYTNMTAKGTYKKGIWRIKVNTTSQNNFTSTLNIYMNFQKINQYIFRLNASLKQDSQKAQINITSKSRYNNLNNVNIVEPSEYTNINEMQIN